MIAREGAEERARPIRMLLLDADGVLTDGRFTVGPEGEEWKTFHARDGLGIKIAQAAGLGVGVISGRRSAALERRASELRLVEFHHGVVDKLRVFEALLARNKLEAKAVAYAGDDLVDVPVLRRAGLAATVPDADEVVARHVHLVTSVCGGHGAVRELIEFILRVQGRWEAILKEYGAL